MLEHVSKYLKYSRIMSREQKTIKTHNAVSVPLNGVSVGTWIDASGFDKLAFTMLSDTNAANNQLNIGWSNDGTNVHGDELALTNAGGQYRNGITDVKARYFRFVVRNNDAAAAHTMSAWAYLKA